MTTPASTLPGPGRFGGSPRWLRPSTPPHQLDGAWDTLRNMDFESLFFQGDMDPMQADETKVQGCPRHEEEKDETVAATMHEKEDGEEDDEDEEQDRHALDPVSVYVRIVANLSRPCDALEHNIAKRFAAACTRLGVGELGDAAHIEALQRAFNGLKMDPVLGYEPVENPAADSASEAVAGCAAASDSLAFVATTPGAAGHAALLNLRHSFLWLKLSDAAANASHCPLTKPCREGSSCQLQGDAEIFVLEPDIKAHFVIAKPTHGYQRLMDALPDHFVGTHERLVRLVNFVCEQMLESFRENGMPVPPWRKNKSILSKWSLPTAKSWSRATTPTGSPSASTSDVVLRGQSVGFGARVVEQQQQLSFVKDNWGESAAPTLEYATPVVGDAALPNRVTFGFATGPVLRMAESA